MKKFLCVLLAVLMLVPSLALADTSSEFSYSENSQSVYIAGDLSQTEAQDGKYVTLLIKDKSSDAIKYIGQYIVDEDGKYEAKFKFDDNLSDCEIILRAGNNPVDSGIEVAYVEKPTLCSLTLRDENNNNFIEPEELLKLTATITNKYNDGGEYKLLLAFYGQDGNLLSCHTVAEGKYNLAEIHKQISEISTTSVPEEAATIKAFLWSNTQKLLPLSKNQIRNVSDKTFGGEKEQVKVAFFGDSITHMGDYRKGIEHYYQTRYPEKDIQFINKGISGNTLPDFLERFFWDVIDDEISGTINEAAIMFGMNDSQYDSTRSSYISNIEKVIKLCRENGISLTIIAPSLYDDTEGFTEATSAVKAERNSVTLKNMVADLKVIAAEYDIPVIDLWTPTTQITNELRAAGFTGAVITSGDRVHPYNQGGTYMAYQFALQQDGNPIVAKVEIDADTKTVNTENATVTLTSAGSARVEYEYLAKAIPFAHTKYYKFFEDDWGVPITEDINQEIIKVSGLEDGNYKIKIGENTLTRTYTASELNDGINIAIDDNNPAQIQSLEAYNLVDTKVKNEDKYRGIAITEQFFIKKNKKPSDYNINSTDEEFTALSNAVYAKSHRVYYSENIDDYGSKMHEVANWQRLRQQEQAAKDMAKPIQRTVVIEKQ